MGSDRGGIGKGACREKGEGPVTLGPPGTGLVWVGSPVLVLSSLALLFGGRASELTPPTQISSPHSTLGKK